MPETTDTTAQGDTKAGAQDSQAGSQADTKAADTKAADAKAGETAAATDAKTTATQSDGQQDGKTGDKDAKAGDGKTDAKTDDSKKAPETYDLKLPDGSPLDKAVVDTVAALAKERGLSNEQAQLLLDQRHESVTQERARGQQLLAEARTKWETDAKGDKEFGGDAFDNNIDTYAKPALDKFFSPEFKKVLGETGYGNHPELIRGLVRIGKAMAEDKPPENANSGSGKKSLAERLYG